MTHKIYRIKNAAEFYVEATGEAVPYLTYEKPCPPEDKVVGEGASDASLEELVGLCDHDAESRNAHDFCGTHRLLGAVLFRKLGRDVATEIFRDIALRGGLQGMSGVCCESDSYAELGVGKCGHDWNGSYGEPPCR